jgi:hypothetical protein
MDAAINISITPPYALSAPLAWPDGLKGEHFPVEKFFPWRNISEGESNNAGFIREGKMVVPRADPSRDPACLRCVLLRDLFFLLCVGCTSPRWQSSLHTFLTQRASVSGLLGLYPITVSHMCIATTYVNTY